MKTTAEKIAIMQAFEDGAEIERRHYAVQNWSGSTMPTWDWSDSDYRIKQKPRDIWVNEYDSGLQFGFFSERQARNTVTNEVTRIAVHYREVLDNED